MKKLTTEGANSRDIKRFANRPILKYTIEEFKATNFSIWNEAMQLERKLQYQARIHF